MVDEYLEGAKASCEIAEQEAGRAMDFLEEGYFLRFIDSFRTVVHMIDDARSSCRNADEPLECRKEVSRIEGRLDDYIERALRNVEER